MLGEIFPEGYDTDGRPTFRPDQLHRRRFPATFPNPITGCLQRISGSLVKATATTWPGMPGGNYWEWDSPLRRWDDWRRSRQTCLGDFRKRGKAVLWPQACFLSLRFPRPEAFRYRPDVSGEWDGDKPKFFVHKPKRYIPPTSQMPWLLIEWLLFQVGNFLLLLYLITVGVPKFIHRKLFKPKKVLHRT